MGARSRGSRVRSKRTPRGDMLREPRRPPTPDRNDFSCAFSSSGHRQTRAAEAGTQWSNPGRHLLAVSSSLFDPFRTTHPNWKSLELICGRPVHRGFSPNDQADLVAMIAGNPDDVVGVEPFPKGASS